MEFNTQILLQLFVTGFMMGGVYALVSTGLTLIYGTLDIVNFAHGSFLMLGMYTTYWLFNLWQIDPYIALPIVAALFFMVGWLVQRGIIERVLGAPLVSQFLITFSLLMIIENTAVCLWTTDLRVVQPHYSFWIFRFHNITVLFPSLVAFTLSVVFSGVCYLFLTKTWTGLAIRATSQNRSVARITGVNIKNMYALAFALGIALVSVAGTLLSVFYPMQPYVGINFLTVAFVIVVLGGLGNYVGAFIGGILIGMTEAVFGFITAPQFKQMFYLFIFIVILLSKPSGLLGKRTRR